MSTYGAVVIADTISALGKMETALIIARYTDMKSDISNASVGCADIGQRQTNGKRKEQTMIKCNTCEFCDVNTNSNETYCEANDGEQIILYRGQCRPKWCPLREGPDNFDVEQCRVNDE